MIAARSLMIVATFALWGLAWGLPMLGCPETAMICGGVARILTVACIPWMGIPGQAKRK